jgi:hypothetical protein
MDILVHRTYAVLQRGEGPDARCTCRPAMNRSITTIRCCPTDSQCRCSRSTAVSSSVSVESCNDDAEASQHLPTPLYRAMSCEGWTRGHRNRYSRAAVIDWHQQNMWKAVRRWVDNNRPLPRASGKLELTVEQHTRGNTRYLVKAKVASLADGGHQSQVRLRVAKQR